MHQNPLGNTGLNVSAIGFGASPLGGVFGPAHAEDGRKAVFAAVDAGINLFDVSPYYGLTLAEERLGLALEGCRQRILLATKCGRYGADRFDFSSATVTHEFHNSLKRLRTDYVDILQVHDIEFGSSDQIAYETLPALRRLQEQGKARFIGITGYWPELLAEAADRTPVDTVLNYCHSNLLMNDMDAKLTAVAGKLQLGLMNASPLHMGLLGGGPVPVWHPAPIAVRRAAERIVALCKAYNVAPAVLALHDCLSHSTAATTFIGLSSVFEVRAAVGALTFDPPPQLLTEVHSVAAEVYNISWPSGSPENQPKEYVIVD